MTESSTKLYQRPPSVKLALVALVVSSSSSVMADESPVPTSSKSISSSMAVPTPNPEPPELGGAIIGNINVINENIFNTADPEENRTIHRWANALHIKTKPDVVSAQLLFTTGETYDKRLIEESERLLRSNRYIRDATITPRRYENGVVDLDVRTSDVWTLSPSISFGRGGGKNTGGIGLKEYNLLGRGRYVGVSYKSDVDRDTTSFRYVDRNISGTRYQLITEYGNASDGFSQRLEVLRPFFELDARRAGGVAFNSGRKTESLYDLGEIASQFEHRFKNLEGHFGWSKGLEGDWTRRYVAGFAYDAHEFGVAPDSTYLATALPVDRKYVYPFLGVELLQNDYVTTRNFDQMNRTEDRHLGMRASFRLGYADQALGSYDNAWLYEGDLSKTLLRTSKSTIEVGANLTGRLENGESRNAQFSLTSRYDKRQSENRLLHVSLTASVGQNLDLENTAYIGGDNGLRGYPLRYQAGDSSVLFTIEQRLFTDWYPFRMFNIGGAAFFDAGRTWGSDPAAGKNYGWLRNVGVGLRIGSTRSGLGRMIHVDLAYPLDGGKDISNVQLLVEARKGF